MITKNIVVLRSEIKQFEEAVKSFKKEIRIINRDCKNEIIYYELEHSYANDLYYLGARVEILKQAIGQVL
jgi:hypothetical protein